MNVGYARTRTKVEYLSVQHHALHSAGCRCVFIDVASGGKVPRPGLAEALDYLRPGDALIVRRLDRLGRDTDQLLQVAHKLKAKGIRLKVLHHRTGITTDGRHQLAELLRDVLD